MIYLTELIKEEHKIRPDHWPNLHRLHHALNYIRVRFNKPLFITSGFRSIAEHLDIYRNKGIHESKVPMGSMHLRGAAADIADPNGVLKKFILDNLEISEMLGLHYEAFEHTPTWVHAQCLPPKSGKRFFIP